MDVFCKIIAGDIPSNICYQTEDIIAIMDANPNSPGHLLIIPKEHYTTILDMDEEIIKKVHNASKVLIKKMEERYPNIRGVRVTVNYGEPQVVKHYHMHLIPVYEKEAIPKMSQEELCSILKD